MAVYGFGDQDIAQALKEYGEYLRGRRILDNQATQPHLKKKGYGSSYLVKMTTAAPKAASATQPGIGQGVLMHVDPSDELAEWQDSTSASVPINVYNINDKLGIPTGRIVACIHLYGKAVAIATTDGEDPGGDDDICALLCECELYAAPVQECECIDPVEYPDEFCTQFPETYGVCVRPGRPSAAAIKVSGIQGGTWRNPNHYTRGQNQWYQQFEYKGLSGLNGEYYVPGFSFGDSDSEIDCCDGMRGILVGGRQYLETLWPEKFHASEVFQDDEWYSEPISFEDIELWFNTADGTPYEDATYPIKRQHWARLRVYNLTLGTSAANQQLPRAEFVYIYTKAWDNSGNQITDQPFTDTFWTVQNQDWVFEHQRYCEQDYREIPWSLAGNHPSFPGETSGPLTSSAAGFNFKLIEA